MPKKAIDYSKCVFYRLVCRDITVKECYVGHTTNEVDRRANHKTNCHNKKSPHFNFLVYRFIRDHGGFDNWELIVHEKRAVEDKIAARLQERYWCEFYKAALNKQVPSRTHKEYDVYYRASHRDDITQRSAKYYADHCEERAQYHADHLEERAAYYAANEARLNEKHECACGGKYTIQHKSTHFKSKRHVAYKAAL